MEFNYLNGMKNKMLIQTTKSFHTHLKTKLIIVIIINHGKLIKL